MDLHLIALEAECHVTYSWVNFPGVLNDDWNGQVDIVRVHQAHSEACEARKGPMHRPLPQHLHNSTAVALISLTRRLPVLSVKAVHTFCAPSLVPAAAHGTATCIAACCDYFLPSKANCIILWIYS